MRKDFIISDGSVLAIEEQDNRVLFLKVTPDGNGMMEVTYSEFMDTFKRLAYVCITSWSTELVERYREFNKAIDEAIKKIAEKY